MADSISTGAAAASNMPISFAHPLSMKLDDKNFLLWNQQVAAVIIAHKLHRVVVNPKIPQKYNSEADRVFDNISDEYQCWIVQDQMLFT